MRQSSIFELHQRKRLRKSVSFVDLSTETESDTVSSHDTHDASNHISSSNPFLTTSTNQTLEIKKENVTKELELGLVPDLSPSENVVVKEEVALKQETLLTIEEHTDLTTSKISPERILRSPYEDEESSENELVKFYDSDSDTTDEGADYEYRHESDIDLNYDSTDEPDYCFTIQGQLPQAPRTTSRTKRPNVLDIDEVSGLELVESASVADGFVCPACRVYMTGVSEQFREAHIIACTEARERAVVAPPPVIKAKAPVLIRKPSYKNRDAKIPSPVRTTDPPKNINGNPRRKPIPELKRLSFPVNPDTSYTVSMDAFNFLPDPSIQMYFLSHFHSDHYGGISKKWCYERLFETVDDFKDTTKYKPLIYCSEVTGKLLTLKYGIDPRFIQVLDFDVKYLIKDFNNPNLQPPQKVDRISYDGLYVTLLTANHCPGSAIFLFESKGYMVSDKKYLHCGDFRVNKAMIQSPFLSKYNTPGSKDILDKVYLDTTYLSFHYNFPKQERVCEEAAQMFHDLCQDNTNNPLMAEWFGLTKQSRITDFIKSTLSLKRKKKFLILVGTYIIGKEKLAIAISKKLGNCPIYISNIKSRDNQYEVVKTFGNEYLDKYVTQEDLGSDDCECMIHLVPMGIVYTMDEMSNYFYHNKYFDHFERCVGLRPTGWSHTVDYSTTQELDMLEFSDINMCPPIVLNQVLSKISDMCSEEPCFTYMDDVLPQNKRVRTSNNPEKDCLRIYSLPYSEHSSYRELSYLCLFLNIKDIIPTVNTESGRSVIKMNNHIGFWKKFKALRKQQDIRVDPAVVERIRQLTINDF